MEEKLKYIIDKCECSVRITVNYHKDMYQTVSEYLDDLGENVDDAERFEMIQRDTIIEIQLYPHTPITSYGILHYDLDMALDEALNILNNP